MNRRLGLAYLLVALILLAALLPALPAPGAVARGQAAGNVSYAVMFPNITINSTRNLNFLSPIFSVTYDPANRYMYLAMDDWVVALGPDNYVASALPGSLACNVLYDPFNHYVYVLNGLNGTLSAIAPNNTIVASVQVPPNKEPPCASIAYDPANHDIYVGSANYLIVVAPDNTIATVVPLSTWYYGFPISEYTYDPANGYMYVTIPPDRTLVIAPNNTVITELPFPSAVVTMFPPILQGGPAAMAYDPANGYMYAIDYNNYLIAIAPNNSVVANVTVGPGTIALAYDPANGYIYVGSAMGYLVAVSPDGRVVANISLVTNRLVTAYEAISLFPFINLIPVPVFPYVMAYDPATQDMLVAFWSTNYSRLMLMAISPSNEVVANMSVSLPTPSAYNVTEIIPLSMTYDPANQGMYLIILPAVSMPGRQGLVLLPALAVIVPSNITGITTRTETTTSTAVQSATVSRTANIAIIAGTGQVFTRLVSLDGLVTFYFNISLAEFRGPYTHIYLSANGLPNVYYGDVPITTSFSTDNDSAVAGYIAITPQDVVSFIKALETYGAQEDSPSNGATNELAVLHNLTTQGWALVYLKYSPAAPVNYGGVAPAIVAGPFNLTIRPGIGVRLLPSNNVSYYSLACANARASVTINITGLGPMANYVLSEVIGGELNASLYGAYVNSTATVGPVLLAALNSTAIAGGSAPHEVPYSGLFYPSSYLTAPATVSYAPLPSLAVTGFVAPSFVPPAVTGVASAPGGLRLPYFNMSEFVLQAFGNSTVVVPSNLSGVGYAWFSGGWTPTQAAGPVIIVPANLSLSNYGINVGAAEPQGYFTPSPSLGTLNFIVNSSAARACAGLTTATTATTVTVTATATASVTVAVPVTTTVAYWSNGTAFGAIANVSSASWNQQPVEATSYDGQVYLVYPESSGTSAAGQVVVGPTGKAVQLPNLTLPHAPIEFAQAIPFTLPNGSLALLWAYSWLVSSVTGLARSLLQLFVMVNGRWSGPLNITVPGEVYSVQPSEGYIAALVLPNATASKLSATLRVLSVNGTTIYVRLVPNATRIAAAIGNMALVLANGSALLEALSGAINLGPAFSAGPVPGLPYGFFIESGNELRVYNLTSLLADVTLGAWNAVVQPVYAAERLLVAVASQGALDVYQFANGILGLVESFRAPNVSYIGAAVAGGFAYFFSLLSGSHGTGRVFMAAAPLNATGVTTVTSYVTTTVTVTTATPATVRLPFTSVRLTVKSCFIIAIAVAAADAAVIVGAMAAIARRRRRARQVGPQP